MEQQLFDNSVTEQAQGCAACTASNRFGRATEALLRPVAAQRPRLMPTWQVLGRELWQSPRILAGRFVDWADRRND
ncbi:hypothetical protein [Chitinimonas sp.]|uniref:hypothetical protein n=1 Tax=Chitinimonas sp. TaxID=1934313 RepID=UPI002F934D9B